MKRKYNMKKLCVVGHFGYGENLLNGQTIKTKIVTEELQKQLGKDEVVTIDTHGGMKALPKIIVELKQAFQECSNIIIMPAHNGIKIFVPLCCFFQKIYERRLHYVVIGGWLPKFLEGKKWLEKLLKNFYGIYVETVTMKQALEEKGFQNIYILPNFKPIKILSEDELVFPVDIPYKVCTFSRVMKEKGIEDAVEAIKRINEKYRKTIYELDIYGQIDEEQKQWFAELEEKFPAYVKYKGQVPYDQSTLVLKDYFVLLFPTRFYTEGIPGTILDAYAAGIPVVSSRWESFGDIIDDGETGIGYEWNNPADMEKVLIMLMQKPEIVNDMKRHCIKKAHEHEPQKVISNIRLL